MGKKKTIVIPIKTPEDDENMSSEGQDVLKTSDEDSDMTNTKEDRHVEDMENARNGADIEDDRSVADGEDNHSTADIDDDRGATDNEDNHSTADIESLDPDEIPDFEEEERAAESEIEKMRLKAEDEEDIEAQQEFEKQRISEETEQAAENEFEIERLKEALEKSQASRAHALADYQNLDKRMNREVARRITAAQSAFLGDLFPIIDTFDRAIVEEEKREEGPDANELRMLRGQLLDALAKQGVLPIDTNDALFDPKIHEALGIVPGTDTLSQHVIEEVRRGFLQGETLLRAAQVIVAA